jgi:hypothetical protein
MIYYLAVAVPVVLFGGMTWCFFFCAACKERRAQAARDEMQMKVARELQAQARKEREAAAMTELSQGYIIAATATRKGF